MKKNIKFLLLLIIFGMVAGFSGYLMKKNNLEGELIISDASNISTAKLFSSNIMNSSGEIVSFSKFEGQWLLINFWATWCAPCREEIPELNEFAHENKTIQTIAIAIDDLESVNKFTNKIPIEYLSLIAENEGVQLSQSLGNERGILPLVSLLALRKRLKRYFMGD